MYGYGYSAYNRLSFFGGVDSNAAAFFVATGITDLTIQEAINTLCVDLKKYGVFDKMKAIYPFVGGTATTHKFNLKDPRDLDVAFRLAFNGGWTHSSNGATPNGTNGYANTFLTPSSNLTLGSHSFGMYSRTSDLVGNKVYGASSISTNFLQNNISAGNFISGNATQLLSYTATPTTGLILGTRTSTTLFKGFRNNVSLGTNTTNASAIVNVPFYFGARNENNATQVFFNSYQHAFGFLGDGLTDTEASNLYYSVQKFQTTLNRQVGTPIYSSNATDVNARLFLGATNIQDATITSAVDTLVQGLKTDGIWSKLKAVYPFVGGTATTHKFNLANALDENSSFRLVFSGGITHSSNGVQGNGVNGFANTNLNILSNLSLTDTHLSFYSRTNLINNAYSNDIASDGSYMPTSSCSLRVRNATPGGTQYFTIGTDNGASISNTNGLGLTLGTTNSLTSRKLFQNGVLKVTQTASNTGTLRNNNVVLLGGDAAFSFNQCAFASIGNHLTDTEVANLYTRVQAFQTTLNRQV